jgi:hypothetical protein
LSAISSLNSAANAGYATTAERVTEKAADAMEDAAEDTVKQLHPAFTKFINRWGCQHMRKQQQAWPSLLAAHV